MKPYHVMEVGRGAVDHLISAHYLHKWPGTTPAILGMLDGKSVIGCIVFSLPPRETITRYGVNCWELARLFIEDGTPKNSETWFIARAIRWIREHHSEVLALVSYADPSAGHNGVIYRAGNWIFDGRTDADRKTPRCDYQDAIESDALNLFGEARSAKRYSRRSHIPDNVKVKRVPRVSKFRFVYWLDGAHEKRRKAAAAKSVLAPSGLNPPIGGDRKPPA